MSSSFLFVQVVPLSVRDDRLSFCAELLLCEMVVTPFSLIIAFADGTRIFCIWGRDINCTAPQYNVAQIEGILIFYTTCLSATGQYEIQNT